MSSLSHQLSIASSDTEVIAPYFDEKYHAAIARLRSSPELPLLVKHNFPKVDFSAFVEYISGLRDVDDFQAKVIFLAVKSLVKHSMTGFTAGGWETLETKQTYLFLSNHRDIICDPSVFSWAGSLQNRRTPQICLGDNLLLNPFITDLIKVNKGVTVKRNLTQRELLRWSKVLSGYLRNVVEKGADSVWLAHREGRSKDGFDKTNPGVLKMLHLSNRQDTAESFRSLRLATTTISYEWDPLDAWKAWEIYWTEKNGSYVKKKGEDYNSMSLGIRGAKGKVHLQVGAPISEGIYSSMEKLSRPEAFELLAGEIDRKIATDYHLWPSHWISYDIVKNSTLGTKYYSEKEKADFLVRVETQLNQLPAGDWDRKKMKELVLLSYANSTENSLPYLKT